MRVRPFRPRDLDAVAAVYAARARVTAAMLRRNRKRWRRFRRKKESRGLWIVAEDRGRVVGYAWGVATAAESSVNEVQWLPAYDGTDLGRRLLDALLARIARRRPSALAWWHMPGQPLAALHTGAGFRPPGAPGGVFMAAVTSDAALLRDAVRILRHRKAALRLRTGGRTATATRGATATAAIESAVLLGLLLGTRSLARELRRGTVRISPRNPASLEILRTAFPERHLAICDEW